MVCTILITGANGFIGSHTAFLFESLGHKVVPLDILPRSRDLSLLGIRTTTHELDVTDPVRFRDLCNAEEVTHIFHAAHPGRDEEPSVLDFCLRATRNVLETAREMKLRRVIFSSSGAVYGRLRKAGHDPLREDQPVAIHPAYLYRSAKILAEWLGDFYSQQHGVDFVALRFSSVYGPGLARGIPLAIKEGLLGRPCRPYLTRFPDDPVYVGDVAEAVRLACFSDRLLSRAYNVASGRAYSEHDLAEAMRRHLPGVRFEIGRHPKAAAVGPHRDRDLLDISLARQELGFAPKVDLDAGVAAIARWVNDNKERLL